MARRWASALDGVRSAKKVVIDGITFDSEAEGKVYAELKLRQMGGQISELRCHSKWDLHAHGGAKIGQYWSDFDFMEGGEMKIVDVKPKSYMTPLAKWKIKHFDREYAPLCVEIYGV